MVSTLNGKTKNNHIDEKTKVQDLKAVKKVLDEENVKYWLDCGALLGAMRDKKLIKWDHDIDLGAWYNDFKKLVTAVKKIDKTKYRVKINEHACSITIRNRDIKGDFYISIQIYEKIGKKAVKKWLIHPGQVAYDGDTMKTSTKGKTKLGYLFKYLLWVFSSPKYYNEKPWFLPKLVHKFLIKLAFSFPKDLRKKFYRLFEKAAFRVGCKYVKIKVPIEYFQDFKKINFYDMKILVPSKAEKYLEYRYGEDWKIPKKKWIFYNDYTCLSK